MMLLLFFVLLSILFLTNYFFIKKNILIDKSFNSHDSHKNFINLKNNKVPLSGGFFFLISLTFLIFSLDPILYFLFSLIYFIGLLSDIHFLNSAKIRIIFQSLIIFLLIFYTEVSIKNIRIPIFDYLLSYKLVSIMFTTFCILVLINGSNFIDGVNTLLCGYILLVVLTITYVSHQNHLSVDQIIFQYFFITLVIFFIFNFLNKCFFGDSGAYLTSCFLGFNLLLFFLNNNKISPYFIAVLLWYPAFENLFSIIKRFYLKKKSYLPDNTHLHHKIFLFLSNMSFFKKNHLSTATGLLINFYNFLVFVVASQDIFSTKFQFKIILFNIVFYLVIYYYLSKNIKRKKLI